MTIHVIKTRTTTLGDRKLEILFLHSAHPQAMVTKYAMYDENISKDNIDMVQT